MHLRTRRATALALLTLLATLTAASAAMAPRAHPAQPDAPPQPAAAQPGDLLSLDGVWVYVEDRTEGRAVEDQGPNMGPRLTFRVEPEAFVIARSDGEIRIPLNGTPTDIPREGGFSRYHGSWADGAFTYDIEGIRAADNAVASLIRIALRPTPEGLLVSVAVDPAANTPSVCLFRHPQDIPLPTPAAATINDLAWLAGPWVGTRGEGNATSIEERWTPPGGGAMLGVSRTVRGGAMRAFEFLRIVERDGGLVYIAQPGGRPGTEFVLTEISQTKAVFMNPRHDSPQLITYQLSPEGALTASIGFINGGPPRPFNYHREPSQHQENPG